MYFAINVLHFMLATKDAFIRDLQAVSGNMSTIKCALVCHNDMKCGSYFHDQSFMKCYPYFRDIHSLSKDYEERKGMNYYVNTIDAVEKWCINEGHNYSAMWSTCYSRSQSKDTWDDADIDCKDRHGWLFVVDSVEEHMFFLDVVQRELEGEPCFIGGWRDFYGFTFDDPWRWSKTRNISKSEFRWHTDEPTNSESDNHDCIQYSKKGKKYLWDDVDCDTPNNYYCHYVKP